MLTDSDIQDLINLPKRIISRDPSKGYTEEDLHKRCRLKLETSSSKGRKRFSVFVRQNLKFIENYSIGLRYRTDDRTFGTITLVRYNGPHGDVNRHPDGHHAYPHIHRITADDVVSGNMQPTEKHREITDRYNTYEQAIAVFFDDISVSNYHEFFLESLQGRLLNGY